jgi:hypothetical protein
MRKQVNVFAGVAFGKPIDTRTCMARLTPLNCPMHQQQAPHQQS